MVLTARTRAAALGVAFAFIATLGLAGGRARAESKARVGKTKDNGAAKSSTKAKDGAGDDAAGTTDDGAAGGGKSGKAKVLTFTGLDLEGKLKTPQLLYFLNRVRVELDSSTPSKRSFMKELERTADDKGL